MSQNIAIVGGLPLLVLFAAAATAAPVLDQSQTQTSGGGYVWVDREVAQTFTAGLSGYLSSVDVYPDAWTFTSIYTLRLRITETTAGKPDHNQVLGSAIVPSGQSIWQSINFTNQNIPITAGRSYALWFTSDDPTSADPGVGVRVNWSGDVYSAGQAFARAPGAPWSYWTLNGLTSTSTPADIPFRTYLVPEPTALGALCLLARRRRR